MWKIVWVFAGVGILFAALVAAATSASHFTLDHPKFQGKKVVVSQYGAVVRSDTAEIPGKLQVTEASYDFGVMDPRTMGSHTFTLTNIGEGELRLKNMGTSCTKCTVANMTKTTLLPGESSEVEVEFDCGPGPHYSQTVTIGVENDLKQKSLQLRVEGRVRMHLGAEPAEVTLEGVPSGRSAEASSLIYSQKFADAEILEVKSSHPDFLVELKEVDLQKYPEQDPTWARQLFVKIPDNLPSGHFSELVWVTVRLPSAEEDGTGEVTRIDVNIKGTVNRGISITGETIDATGVITLGILPLGVEKKVKLTLKIQNKSDRDLKLQRVECTPDFLQVKVAPKADVDPALGLYDIFLTVPADAPSCNYMREGEMGQIRFVTENPFLGELPLAVLFAVREDG